MTIQNARIIACGSYLPEQRVHNNDLAARMETSDEWIQSRTGIEYRHKVADGQSTSDLAALAAKDALERGAIDPKTIDLIIVATTTPDSTFPATAVKVQKKLGLPVAAALDVQAVCSGFVYGMILANACIVSGQAKRALVIGADTMSSVVDWHDRSTAVLFGDGAGAVVLEKGDGILSSNWYADGRLEDILYTDGGVSSTGTVGKLRMQGKEVFRHAVEKMVESAKEALHAAHLTSTEIDWLIPHQANARILSQVASKLAIDEARVIQTVAFHANTSAASIPLALADADRKQKLKSGQHLLFTALGAGITWGSIVLKW